MTCVHLFARLTLLPVPYPGCWALPCLVRLARLVGLDTWVISPQRHNDHNSCHCLTDGIPYNHDIQRRCRCPNNYTPNPDPKVYTPSLPPTTIVTPEVIRVTRFERRHVKVVFVAQHVRRQNSRCPMPPHWERLKAERAGVGPTCHFARPTEHGREGVDVGLFVLIFGGERGHKGEVVGSRSGVRVQGHV